MAHKKWSFTQIDRSDYSGNHLPHINHCSEWRGHVEHLSSAWPPFTATFDESTYVLFMHHRVRYLEMFGRMQKASTIARVIATNACFVSAFFRRLSSCLWSWPWTTLSIRLRSGQVCCTGMAWWLCFLHTAPRNTPGRHPWAADIGVNVSRALLPHINRSSASGWKPFDVVHSRHLALIR